MVKYRRNKPNSPDAVFFLTIVTKKRYPWFFPPDSCKLCVQAMRRMIERHNVSFPAWVILPEHIHWLIKPNDADYSKVVFSFKRWLSAELKKSRNLEAGQLIWHNRFWEHTVRNDEELSHYTEYIHHNRVKHGLVKSPIDWRFSSFRKYVKSGIYDSDWAAGDEESLPGIEYDL